jgi:peptide/nickel transport system ATP-binding protein
VSLDLAAGEVRGLVGESGAGKSMIGKAVLGILPPSVEITGGEILLEGTDLLRLPPAERRRRIGASCALIPQDPLTALNPSHRIGPQITDRLVDILGWTRAAPMPAPANFWPRCRSPTPTACCDPIRTSCRAACASAS